MNRGSVDAIATAYGKDHRSSPGRVKNIQFAM
jgi:hypothetical protein